MIAHRAKTQRTPVAPPPAGWDAVGPGTTVYVAGLPKQCSDAEMQGYFARFGVVECVVAKTPEGVGRGFGYATFAADAVANRVLGLRGQLRFRNKTLDVRPDVTG